MIIGKQNVSLKAKGDPMKRKWIPGMLDIAKFTETPKPWMMRWAMDGLRRLLRFSNLPVVRKVHPWSQKSKTSMYWIPVNKTLERGTNVPLPYEVVEHFIDQSSERVIMDFCGCRAAYQCKRFPADIGCLMMGPDAKRIPPEFSRPASKEEAKKHLQRAIEAGLPPLIGKARVDNFIFGVPDNGRLLTVCFCCDCCCITGELKRLPPEERKAMIRPLDGLEISVDKEKCVGCGQCITHCTVNAITMDSQTAQISCARCQGCGRCVSVCGQNAIRIRLNNPDFVENTVKSIREHVIC